MKIIVSVDRNIPSRWAHSFGVMGMARGFMECGNDVSVLSSLSLTTIRNLLLARGVHNYYLVSKKIKIKRIIDIKEKITNRYYQKAIKYVKDCKPDLVYCRDSLLAYYAVKEGIPTILETHDSNGARYDLKKISGVADASLFLGLITIHCNLMEEYVRNGYPANKVHVFESGVEVKRFDETTDDKLHWRKALGLPKEEKIVMYCGHLYKEKGVDQIVMLAQNMPNVQFVLVGGIKEDQKFWQGYCKQRRVHNIKFVGFVSQSNLPKFYKAADVLIMPYNLKVDFKVMHIHTTSPLKLFEYMASKRPIVSTNIPTIAKVLKHGYSGLLAEPNNIEQLKEYTNLALSNSAFSRELSENAYKDVQKFDWRIRCKNILSNTGKLSTFKNILLHQPKD